MIVADSFVRGRCINACRRQRACEPLIKLQREGAESVHRLTGRLFNNGHRSDGASLLDSGYRANAANFEPQIGSQRFGKPDRQRANSAVQDVGNHFRVQRRLSTVGPCFQNRPSSQPCGLAKNGKFARNNCSEILKNLFRATACDGGQSCQRQRSDGQVVGESNTVRPADRSLGRRHDRHRHSLL